MVSGGLTMDINGNSRFCELMIGSFATVDCLMGRSGGSGGEGLRRGGGMGLMIAGVVIKVRLCCCCGIQVGDHRPKPHVLRA